MCLNISKKRLLVLNVHFVDEAFNSLKKTNCIFIYVQSNIIFYAKGIKSNSSFYQIKFGFETCSKNIQGQLHDFGII